MVITPFSLRIFVADGDPDGLRTVEKSNWIGKALVFPRALLPQVKARPELAQTGVYLLLGPRPDGEGEMLYVGEGEGDPILPRLQDHQSKKDFWTRAIARHHGHGRAAEQGACAVSGGTAERARGQADRLTTAPAGPSSGRYHPPP